MNREEIELQMEEFDYEEDYQKMTKAKEAAKKPLEKIARAQNFVVKRENQLKENMAFYQGNPYLLKQYQDNRPWVVQMNTPYASMAIDTRVASLAANDYIGELQPLEEKDVETIRTLQEVLKDEWEHANVNALIDQSILTSAILREAYVHVIFDDSRKYGGRKGEISAYALETPAVLIDPRARCYKDAQYVVVQGRISYEEAEEDYPEFVRAMNTKGTGVSPERRGEVFMENDYTTEQEGIFTVYTMYEKVKGKIVKKVILEDMLVEEKTLSGLKTFPVAQLRWKKSAQSAYGISLMDDLLSLQKAICAIESAITNTAVAYASPSIIVRKGSGINPKVVALTTGAPGAVYVSEIPISEAMQPVTQARIDDKIVALKQEFENSIDKIAGVTNQFIGDIGTAGNTSGGAQLAVERAKIIETNVLINITEFIEYLTVLFVDYITTAYAGETITSRATQKTDETTPRFISRNVPEKASEAQFTFSIDLNLKTQYSKQREREALLELYQMERQYDSPVKLINELDILERYDLSNEDELKERYKLLQQQTTQIKTETIMKITQAGTQYQVDPNLMQAAIMEIVEGAKETPALDQVMTAIEDAQAAMQQEMQASQDDLVAQGLDPNMVAEAAKQMEAEGQQPSMQDLGM